MAKLTEIKMTLADVEDLSEGLPGIVVRWNGEKARIADGRVKEARAFLGNPEGRASARLKIVRDLISKRYDGLLEIAAGGASPQRQVTWQTMRHAAELQLTGASTFAPEYDAALSQMIAGEAAADGITADDLARKIMAKSDLVTRGLAAVATWRAKLDAAAKAASADDLVGMVENLQRPSEVIMAEIAAGAGDD